MSVTSSTTSDEVLRLIDSGLGSETQTPAPNNRPVLAGFITLSVNQEEISPRSEAEGGIAPREASRSSG